MDSERFLRELPGLYQDWGTLSVRPGSDHLDGVLTRVRGMTTPAVLQLLNCALNLLEPGESYVEVGCFQGATLIGALLGNPGVTAHAADNFSEFDPQGDNERLLQRHLEEFGVAAQVQFARQHAEAFLRALRAQRVRCGVYLYDGGHDYRSQLLGLLLAVPLLADRALLVVDDANFPAVRQATWDFLAVERRCRLLLELPTPGNGHGSFWNGLFVLGWDAHSDNGYDWEWLQRQRQEALLHSLDVLQGVNLRRDGDAVHVSWTG